VAPYIAIKIAPFEMILALEYLTASLLMYSSVLKIVFSLNSPDLTQGVAPL